MTLPQDKAPSSGKARVWFVNRFFWPDHSATSQILSDLAFHLAASGREVGVIAARGLYDKPGDDLPEQETKDGVAIHRVVRPRFGRSGVAGRAIDYLAMYRAFAAALGRLARRGDLVVAKTDPPLLSCALAPVARAKGLRQINWLQDLYPEVALGLGMTALKPVAPLLTAARDASLRGAHNVAIGETMARRLQARGIAPQRISVIPNWSDDASVRPIPAEQNALRAEWGMSGKFVVGYSGNLGRAHEYATLLDAAERLRGEPDLAFLFIGGGHGAEALKRDVEARGLGGAVRVPALSAGKYALAIADPAGRALDLAQARDGRPDRAEQVLRRRRRGPADHRRFGAGRGDRRAGGAIRLWAERRAERQRRARRRDPGAEGRTGAARAHGPQRARAAGGPLHPRGRLRCMGRFVG